MEVLQMQTDYKHIRILVADDDEDDRLMIKDALLEARVANNISFVEDGEDLMDFLKGRGEYSGGKNGAEPGLILLDLNMPRKDGREALKEIKEDPDLKGIPVVVMTTSGAEEDIIQSYDLGVNSFITKPVTFEGLVKVMKTLTEYWFSIVKLPKNGGNGNHG
jgi:CheY-like chemotaxis protein